MGTFSGKSHKKTPFSITCGKPNMPKMKPERRGNKAGMREVSRAILKENGQLEQKGAKK